ncbi:MAG: ABC transporter permease [Pseudomonadota bacterium]
MAGLLLRQIIPVVLGVTLLGFLLMVHFGPDRALELAGRNPTLEEVERIRQLLRDDRPLVVQYAYYLKDLFTLNLGRSDFTNEPVREMLARTLPNSLALLLPGFVLGQLLALALAAVAAHHQGRGLDRYINLFALITMSISFVVIMMAMQVLLASRYGLNWFPARGWSLASPLTYLKYVAVPTLVILVASCGYNLRFYRALFLEALGKPHVQAARALGYTPWRLMTVAVLPNTLLPIATRLMYAIPSLLVGGSLLLETYFGIPGIGRITFDAIANGDQPVLKAILGLSSLLMALVMIATDRLYSVVDPRIHG